MSKTHITKRRNLQKPLFWMGFEGGWQKRCTPIAMPFFNKSPPKWGRCRKNCHNERHSTTKHARANGNCKHKHLCVLTETDGNHLIRPNINTLTWKEQQEKKKRGGGAWRSQALWPTPSGACYDPVAQWGHELGTATGVTNFATLCWFPMQVATGIWTAARSSDKVAKLAIPHCLFCHAALTAVKPHSEAKLPSPVCCVLGLRLTIIFAID